MTKIITAYTSLKDDFHYVIAICHGAWYIYGAKFSKASKAVSLEMKVKQRGEIDTSKWVQGS